MKELIGQDIFELVGEADAIVIPTNCSIDEDGNACMGGGIAGQAAHRWPAVKLIYGLLLRMVSHVPVILGWIDRHDGDLWSAADFLSDVEDDDTALIAYPTMHSIMEPADLQLVKRSADLLVELADIHEWKQVAMGHNGCGIGGLSWEDQVKPYYQSVLDDRFLVCGYETKKTGELLMKVQSTEKW